MMIIAYILAILIGVVLGLFGAGGSILSFPILVYFMEISPEQASVYSLIVVGISAIAGSIKYIKNKEVDIHVSILFSLPVIISFYLTKQFLLSNIPHNILSIGNYMITKNALIMLLFIIVLSIVIYKIFYTNTISNEKVTKHKNMFSFKYILYSSMVGAIAAAIGAGGGFIIVPALMSIFYLPIKKATGTSLIIISINAIIGSMLNFKFFANEHIIMIILFSIISIIGIFIGAYLHKIILSSALKRYYGYFLLLILISTTITEIYKNYQSIK